VFGKGLVYYVGAYLDPTSQQSLVDRVLKNAEIRWLATPPGVEVRTRVRADGDEVHFVINHSPVEQMVALPWPAYDHLSGSSVDGELKLGPYGVAVLT
jgi:beta-galactosidase GanA